MRTAHLLLAAVTLGGAAFVLSGCCDGCGDIAKFAGNVTQIITEMSTAPGTAEMKKAGCVNAFVMTPETMERLEKALKELDPNANEIPPLPYTVATCQINNKKSELSCEKLAKIYVGAVKPADQFGVTVTLNADGKSESTCTGVFSTEGERLGDMDEKVMGSVNNVGK